MKQIDVAERRARLACRHHLAPTARAATPEEASASLVGLHATDPASVYLAAFARTRDLEIATLERALYDDRSLLKILGMRRTMFVVPVDLAAVIQAACTRGIAAGERKRTLQFLAGAPIADRVDDISAWLDQVEAETVAALEQLGEATANDLTKLVPGLREQIPVGIGRKWEGTIGVSTRMLFLLAAEGRIIRGRPRGSWLSSQYRWVPMDRWVPGGGLPHLPTDAARVELARRWLRAFGPGTEADLRWWAGWTLTETRKALGAVGAVEVGLDGGRGFVLPDDLDVDPPAALRPEPFAALLPALDPTVMGWQDRSYFLGSHGPALFDRNGNAGPTAWWDGRVVGGWVQRPDGEIAWRVLEDVGAEACAAIEAEAHRVRAWLGDARFTPRFRTPLEQELIRS